MSGTGSTSRLPTRKPSGTPPRSQWSPSVSPETGIPKRRASLVPTSSTATGAPAAVAGKAGPAKISKKEPRPSTGSDYGGSGSTLPRLRSFKSMFGKGGAASSASKAAAPSKRPSKNASQSPSNGAESPLTADQFVKLDEVTDPPLKRASQIQQPQPFPTTAAPLQARTPSSSAGSSIFNGNMSQKPSKDTLRIMTSSPSRRDSSTRHSETSSLSETNSRSGARVSKDFVRPETEPSLASLRAGMVSPLSLARKRSASPNKLPQIARETLPSDDMAYRRLSISPKIPEAPERPGSDLLSTSPALADRNLLNESPTEDHRPSPQMNGHEGAHELVHRPSVSSFVSAYSTAASNQATSVQSADSSDHPAQLDNALHQSDDRPGTPEAALPAVQFASPRQARREALPPEEGSPGLASLHDMFKTQQHNKRTSLDVPLYSPNNINTGLLRRSASERRPGSSSFTTSGTGLIKSGSPVLVQPTFNLNRSASVAERVNLFEAAASDSREDRRTLRAARTRSEAVSAFDRAALESAKDESSLRPRSMPQRPLVSPLDTLVRDLSDSIAEQQSLEQEPATDSAEPESGAASSNVVNEGVSPKTLVRGSMTIEEMEREIARMEAELALGSSPTQAKRSLPNVTADAKPTLESKFPPPPPIPTTNGSSQTTTTDITPRTARKWSIVEVEQAYSRMKELLGSTRAAGYAESAWSEAGDTDVEHAFERAIGGSRNMMNDSFSGDPDDSVETLATTPSSIGDGTPIASQLPNFPSVPTQSANSDLTLLQDLRAQSPPHERVSPLSDTSPIMPSDFAAKQPDNQVYDDTASRRFVPSPTEQDTPRSIANVRTSESLRSAGSESASEGEGWTTPFTSPPPRFQKTSSRPATKLVLPSTTAEPSARDTSATNGLGYIRDFQSLDAVLEDREMVNGARSIQTLPSKLNRSNTVDTWFPTTPARLPHRRATHRGLGLIANDSQHQKNSSLVSIRSMDKLEIYFKYTAAKAELDRAELERDALIDALEETRVALDDVRSQRDAVSEELRRERAASHHLKKYLGNESADQANQLEDLAKQAREATHELEIARYEAEELAQMVLDGREREEQLEHDNLVMAAKLASYEGRSRAAGSSQTSTSNYTSTAHDQESFTGRRRTPSRSSIGSAEEIVGESPLLTQRMAFGPKSSFGSISSPLKSRKENGMTGNSPTITLSRIAALSAARKASMDRNGHLRAVSGATNSTTSDVEDQKRTLNGPGGQRHVSNSSTISTTSDFGDHLPPRDWLASSRRGKVMGELDEADERFLSDLTSR